MKKLFIAAIMLFSLNMGIQAQSVQKQGNNFTQVNNKKSSGKVTKTQYTYTDSKGVVHPVYLSATGKAFIYYINKKGEQKRRYMPEIGKQINPEAYKDKK
jgi:hypothetical protein